MSSSYYKPPFDVELMSYSEALACLKRALRFGIDPKLESVEDMLEVLCNPDSYYKSIQIAGTNGKTSTSRYTARILNELGYRTGLYTSPGLVSYTDRIELCGACVSEAEFARGISFAYAAAQKVNAKREDLGMDPYSITEFDLITCAACVIYAEHALDVVVFECGMGGRWDATSAISSISVVGITGIGLDHTKILGDTKELIAAEKAAIIKSGRACVLGMGTHEETSVFDVIATQCKKAKVTPRIVIDEPHKNEACANIDPSQIPYELVRVSTEHTPRYIQDTLQLTVSTPHATYQNIQAFKPVYQAANIAMAVALCEEFLHTSLEVHALQRAVIMCPTPGRFDLLRSDPYLLVDACHNPQSVKVFIQSLQEMDALQKSTSEGMSVQVSPSSTCGAAQMFYGEDSAVSETIAVQPSCATLVCAMFKDKDVAHMIDVLGSYFSSVICTQTNNPRCMPADELAHIFIERTGVTPEMYGSVEEVLPAIKDRCAIACGTITLAGELSRLFFTSNITRANSHA